MARLRLLQLLRGLFPGGNGADFLEPIINK